ILGSILTRTLVPSPDSVAQPSASPGGAKDRLRERLDGAIVEHNRDHPDRALPPAREVSPWDHTQRHGTVLALGGGDYAISTGRGDYRTFDANDVRSQTFRTNEYIELERDGTIRDRDAHLQTLHR
ncbi:MAG: hypothetical protein IAI49_11340, partial [Candidatus Eremiobacteraeota bacterium]|nr:hypothetical protein [Candidatus Eremiobacteraeota bacterium]